ncbi:hypothetical protein ACFL6R_04350 [Gemmatimonadota bacterium]
MTQKILLYAGALLPVIWGVAHLFPTRSVVEDFGEISEDNRRIITMEWIIEGVALIFIGVIVAAATMIDHTGVLARTICWISIVMLNVLSVISLQTGFKIKFLPFKLCPVIFTSSSVLILLGLLL